MILYTQATNSLKENNLFKNYGLLKIGALTSKPYSFKGRPWELKTVESIDFFDVLGSNILVDVRGLEILRISPRYNADINEHWISDKIRFFFDSYKYQRLSWPLVLHEGKFLPVYLNSELIKFSNTVKNYDCILGDFLSLESYAGLKYVLGRVSDFYRVNYSGINYDFNFNLRKSYISDVSLSNLSSVDYLLLLGLNPRYEAPVLNIRIKELLNSRVLKYVVMFGFFNDLGYNFFNLGNDIRNLKNLFSFRLKQGLSLYKSKKPLVLVGQSVIQRKDNKVFFNLFNVFNSYSSNKLNVNFIFSNMSVLNSFELGFDKNRIFSGKSLKRVSPKETGLLAFGGLSEEISLLNSSDLNSMYDVRLYFGHHGAKSAKSFTHIFGMAAPLEESGLYVNVDGNLQVSRKVLDAPKGSYSLVDLFFFYYSKLAGVSSKTLDKDIIFGYLNTFLSLKNIGKTLPLFSLMNRDFDKDSVNVLLNGNLNFFHEDYLLSDVFSQVSPVLSLTSSSFLKEKNFSYYVY